MADKKLKRILTDVATGTWVNTIRLTPGKTGIGGPGSWSIVKRRLHGGLADGVDVIEVNNGKLSFTIVPTRGMGLWKGHYGDCEIGWRSPVTGPVNPQFVNVMENGGLGWLQGFDECIVRCGLNSNGAPGQDIVPDNNGNPTEIMLPLHGRISNSPAHHVEVAVREVAGQVDLEVSGIVDEGMPFFPCLRLSTRITTSAGSNAVTIHDEISNRSTVPQELELLYHCNFGTPFLGKGSRLVAPVRLMAPRDARAGEGIAHYDTYAAPTPGFVEQCYFYQLAADRKGNTLTMLRNAAGTRGVVLRFNVRQLPCFTQWKNTVGADDGYVTGLEPGTNYPNPKCFEREKGRVIRLTPGQVHRADLVMEVHDAKGNVAGVESEICALMDGRTPRILDHPHPDWSLIQ